MSRYQELLDVLPSSIYVCGSKYTIEYHKSIPGEDPETTLHGDCHYEDKLIRIMINKPANMHNTLLHEYIHAILAQTGWTHLLSAIGEKAEEGLTVNLEESLNHNVRLGKKVWNEAKIAKAYLAYTTKK